MEAEMIRRGEERGRINMAKNYERGQFAQTPAGIALAKRALEPYIRGIEEWREKALQGNITRTAMAARLMEGLDAEFMAYIACRTIITCASRQYPLGSTARQICNNLEAELVPQMLKERNEAVYTTTLKNAQNRTQNPLRQSMALRRAGQDLEGIPMRLWTLQERLHLGTKLVDLFIETVGVVRANRYVDRRKTKITLEFTEKIGKWFHNFNELAYLSKPFFLPMTEKPKRWDDVEGGGFRQFHINIVTKATLERLEILRTADLSMVYDSLNALQETPWAINSNVLTVMRQLWDADVDHSFLPRKSGREIPEAPQEVIDDERGGAIRKEWRIKLRRIYEENARSRSVRFEFARTLQLAEMYQAFERFYFVHRLDFRGRVYALSTSLNPQASDNVRGLLQFAEGKPLDERAKWWLGIHGANLYGEDKISLKERSDWAEDFFETAKEIAADPLGTTHIWGEAEDPWQFLAWCFEWSQKDVPGFLSHIPIHLDGSCNGIQHYSALLRDEVGGKAVNLVPGPRPADIYQEVANRVNERLAEFTMEDDPEAFWKAQAWLAFGIDRKITKRSVMVLPYGGTSYSCVDYVREAVREKIADGHPSPFGESDIGSATAWLGMRVWECIGDVVIKAREAMAWLQQVADVCSAHEVPIQWETPSGFVVFQRYRQCRHRRINTTFQGSIIKYRQYEEIDPIDRRKQRTALAPNFIHSLDAAVLMLTIETARAVGVENFAMVHDSYGTHAADTEALANATRSSFYVLYNFQDFLRTFRDEVQARLPEGVELPPLPSFGTLDLDQVLKSDYFFA